MQMQMYSKNERIEKRMPFCKDGYLPFIDIMIQKKPCEEIGSPVIHIFI